MHAEMHARPAGCHPAHPIPRAAPYICPPTFMKRSKKADWWNASATMSSWDTAQCAPGTTPTSHSHLQPASQTANQCAAATAGRQGCRVAARGQVRPLWWQAWLRQR